MLPARFVFMPPPAKLPRVESRFKAPYNRTLELLEHELLQVHAKEVTIQAGFPDNQIRQDGWPFGRATSMHPACAVQFLKGKERLIFECAKYSTFYDNLRSIALTLEALRSVDRYGCVSGQQYTGFKQLAAPSDHMTREEARHFISQVVNDGNFDSRYESWLSNTSDEELRNEILKARRKSHPDVPGGSHDQFVKVGKAADVLGLNRPIGRQS